MNAQQRRQLRRKSNQEAFKAKCKEEAMPEFEKTRTGCKGTCRENNPVRSCCKD